MEVLYITAKSMIPLNNTLVEMGWQQPQTLIQTDNSTAVGFTNKIFSTKLPNQRIRNCDGSETGNHKSNSGTIGCQGMKMKDITEQSIILLYIMKQREQTHTWYDYLSLVFLST